MRWVLCLGLVLLFSCGSSKTAGPAEDGGIDLNQWDLGQNSDGCIDVDGDGFGEGCEKGADCDDGNPHLNVYCPPCENGIYEGCPCSQPDQVIMCYDGDPSYLGIGVCVQGEQSCSNGYWTGCVGQIEPTPEVCDGADNDCDGEVDENVLSPCGDCDPLCNHLAAGPDKIVDFDLTEDNSNGVVINSDGYIILDSSKSNMAAIWIANSEENTVSKLDTETGKELGRYHVCQNPSRTSVDLYGDVWVGCRSDGKVAKIALNEIGCVDVDMNGTIETSRDENDDGVISGEELLQPGLDECVLFVVQPGEESAAPRALAVDKENHLWVGMSNGDEYFRLHPQDGSVVQHFTIPDGQFPYGAAIDKNGVIWASHRNGKRLARIDVNQDPPDVQLLDPGGCVEPYGIAVDAAGDIWMGNSGCDNVIRYRTDTQTFDHIPINVDLGNTRGVAASQDGFVYIAHHDFGVCEAGRHVTRINIDNLNASPLALDPDKTMGAVGVALDFDGYLWAVNQCDSSATKVDPATGEVKGTFPVGAHPYTYSDMTGYALHNFTNPVGHYRQVFGGWGIRVIWTGVIVNANVAAGTWLKVRVRNASSLTELYQTAWSDFFGPFPPETFPLDLTPLNLAGQYLQVEVSLHSDDDQKTPILKSIEVQFQTGDED